MSPPPPLHPRHVAGVAILYTSSVICGQEPIYVSLGVISEFDIAIFVIRLIEVGEGCLHQVIFMAYLRSVEIKAGCCRVSRDALSHRYTFHTRDQCLVMYSGPI